jgi:hypothetical protein
LPKWPSHYPITSARRKYASQPHFDCPNANIGLINFLALPGKTPAPGEPDLPLARLDAFEEFADCPLILRVNAD